MDPSLEPLSDHPFFRALVLMGGGLALSCGGRAEDSRAANYSSAGAASSAGGASNGGSAGTTTVVVYTPSSAGALSVAGAPSVMPLPEPDCPYAQWDCSAIEPVCYLALASLTDPIASKCVCDSKRPVTANDCGKDESLVCLQAYWQDGTLPGTWDNQVHVQCSCVKSPTPVDSCNTACSTAFPTQAMIGGGERIFGCRLPPSTTCDDNGTCTATSADVLRQDGIMCGCADIGLR
jgi:hypothetical protein